MRIYVFIYIYIYIYIYIFTFDLTKACIIQRYTRNRAFYDKGSQVLEQV